MSDLLRPRARHSAPHSAATPPFASQVYVFCCTHADLIKQHLAGSKWAKNRDMVVTTIVSTSCVSVGEALRLIDYRDVIQNDFILVSGDTVSNVNLAPIIRAHKDRRAVDKQAIFTMVGAKVSDITYQHSIATQGGQGVLQQQGATLRHTGVTYTISYSRTGCTGCSNRDHAQVLQYHQVT
jgi:NDP-sugar pyrophosphorylase family protein